MTATPRVDLATVEVAQLLEWAWEYHVAVHLSLDRSRFVVRPLRDGGTPAQQRLRAALVARADELHAYIKARYMTGDEAADAAARRETGLPHEVLVGLVISGLNDWLLALDRGRVRYDPGNPRDLHPDPAPGSLRPPARRAHRPRRDTEGIRF